MSPDAPDYVQNVLGKMMCGEGDSIPVSQMPVDGITVPDSEFDVDYHDNIAAGTAVVTVRAKTSGNFSLRPGFTGLTMPQKKPPDVFRRRGP